MLITANDLTFDSRLFESVCRDSPDLNLCTSTLFVDDNYYTCGTYVFNRDDFKNDSVDKLIDEIVDLNAQVDSIRRAFIDLYNLINE